MSHEKRTTEQKWQDAIRRKIRSIIKANRKVRICLNRYTRHLPGHTLDRCYCQRCGIVFAKDLWNIQPGAMQRGHIGRDSQALKDTHAAKPSVKHGKYEDAMKAQGFK